MAGITYNDKIDGAYYDMKAFRGRPLSEVLLALLRCANQLRRRQRRGDPEVAPALGAAGTLEGALKPQGQ